jgi:hypothetical protein
VTVRSAGERVVRSVTALAASVPANTSTVIRHRLSNEAWNVASFT